MKILFHLHSQTLKPYPRADDDPVVGLSPEYEVFDVIEEPQPSYDTETHTCAATETIDTQAKTVTRGWTVQVRPPESKIWTNAQAFMSAFTMEEKAAVALSSDPIIAALRLELSTWLSPVHVNDERVQLGLNRLVELEILTNDRKNAIISVAS
jgi:hypothetical protein